MNVLVHSANAGAAEHGIARQCLIDAIASPGGIGFAWHALLGFLRITTRPGILAKPLSVDQAMSAVELWLALPNVAVVQPGATHAALLRELLNAAGKGGSVVPDAHLAALAIEHNADLVSFDRDFAQFQGLRFRLLQKPRS